MTSWRATAVFGDLDQAVVAEVTNELGPAGVAQLDQLLAIGHTFAGLAREDELDGYLTDRGLHCMACLSAGMVHGTARMKTLTERALRDLKSLNLGELQEFLAAVMLFGADCYASGVAHGVELGNARQGERS